MYVGPQHLRLSCVISGLARDAVGRIGDSPSGRVDIRVDRAGATTVVDDSAGWSALCGTRRFASLHDAVLHVGSGTTMLGIAAALSEELVVEVRGNGVTRRQTFARGLPTSEDEHLATGKPDGVTVTYRPDVQLVDASLLDRTALLAELHAYRLRTPRILLDVQVASEPI
jgi:hypothetical protein